MELYDYYRLDERDSESVSGIWKGLHIFLLLSAAVFSIVCAVFLNILNASFDTNCVLYPKEIYLSNVTNPGYKIIHNNASNFNSTYNKIDLPIDFIKSVWSDMNVCYASLYNPVLSVIFGIVWTTFFLMCSKGGKSVSGLIRPWRIVVPSTIFTFTYSILCIIVAQDLSKGLTEFDLEFKNTAGINETIYQDEVKKIDVFVSITLISGWIYTTCWIVAFVLLIIRCLFAADFQLIHVKVELITPEKASDSENAKPAVESSVEPSTSYHTLSSKEKLEPHSVVVRANVEHFKTSDEEDSDAFEDFTPIVSNPDDLGVPQAQSSLLASSSSHDNMPKVNRVSFTSFDIKDQ